MKKYSHRAIFTFLLMCLQSVGDKWGQYKHITRMIQWVFSEWYKNSVVWCILGTHKKSNKTYFHAHFLDDKNCLWCQEWTDDNLRWNESEYGEIKDLRIPPAYIWAPDILMYNRWEIYVHLYGWRKWFNTR